MSSEVTPRVTCEYALCSESVPDPLLRISVYAQRTKEGTPNVLPLLGFSFWALGIGLLLGCWIWAVTGHYGWSIVDPLVVMDHGSRPIW